MVTNCPEQAENLTFSPATRLQDSLVSTAEKRALICMARHTPRWINSDHLTLLGFLSQCMAGVCYALARLHPDFLLAGIVCLALNWLGDSLDGTLARVRNQQRPRYGFYVDHVVDAVATLALFAGLAARGVMSWTWAAAVLIAYYLLFIEVGLATNVLGEFHISAGLF